MTRERAHTYPRKRPLRKLAWMGMPMTCSWKLDPVMGGFVNQRYGPIVAFVSHPPRRRGDSATRSTITVRTCQHEADHAAPLTTSAIVALG